MQEWVLKSPSCVLHIKLSVAVPGIGALLAEGAGMPGRGGRKGPPPVARTFWYSACSRVVPPGSGGPDPCIPCPSQIPHCRDELYPPSSRDSHLTCTS